MIDRSLMLKLGYGALRGLSVDSIFRYLNRSKVLILAYHGVTDKQYSVPPWTLIPIKSFEAQIDYLARRYTVLTLEEATKALLHYTALPKNAAVITFDDGYRNNYTLALPVLERYGVPATIFLTAGYIGSENILPLDEAYLVITHAEKRAPILIPEYDIGELRFVTSDEILRSYQTTVRALKRYPTEVQICGVKALRERLDSKYEGESLEDFRLLTPNDTREIVKSGLIHVGAHTVSHEICTNVPLDAAEREIKQSKTMIESITGESVQFFAYPNGTERDYSQEHVHVLQKAGFRGSVTTTAMFNGIGADPYRLGRICIGPELSKNPHHFALKVSGFNLAFKRLLNV